MKRGHSMDHPPKFFDFGRYKQVIFNVIEKYDEENIKSYYYNYVDVENLNKGEIVRSLIHDKYSIDDEIAILNNYNEDPERYKSDYEIYQVFRNECKIIADNIVNNLPLIKVDKKIELVMPEIYVLKHPSVGNPLFDQKVFDYRDNLISWGCKIFKDNGNIICILNNNVNIDIQDFLFVMSKDGGDVRNFNPYVKIHESKINNKIPNGLPYSNNNNLNTWLKWRDNNHPIDIFNNGYYYFNVNTFDNISLSGTQIMLIHKSVDTLLLDKLDF